MLDEVNPYVINLQYILRLPTENIANLAMLIHADIPGLDLRTFNAPITSQVVAIWVNNEIPTNVIQNRDIVLHKKMEKLIHIFEISACYNPLAYSILFSYGEQGCFNEKFLTKPCHMNTNISETPNNEEDATELENNNKAPTNDEDSTIKNNNAINCNVSTKQHRKF
ncbi:20326_t:CDS:2, partial [Gigaspora rosea]